MKFPFPILCEMKNRSPSNRKMQLAFGSAILTLLAVGMVSYLGMVASSESDRSARHVERVIANLLTLFLKPRKDS